jgi:hypothetical protein
MQKLMNEIQFLVINMDSQPDRWESCLLQGSKFRLDLIRISAITPRLLSNNSQHFVTDGVRAVWESHMQCFRYFLSTDMEHALIMEDDFKILDFDKLKSHLQNFRVLDYDLVQFGFLAPGLDTRIKIFIANFETSVFRFISFLSRFPFLSKLNFQIRLRVKEAREIPRGFTSDDFQPGAHCYLISRAMAEAVLELNNPQFLCIDDFFTAFSQMRSFKSIRSRKSLVGQAPFAKWEGDRFLNSPQ